MKAIAASEVTIAEIPIKNKTVLDTEIPELILCGVFMELEINGFKKSGCKFRFKYVPVITRANYCLKFKRQNQSVYALLFSTLKCSTVPFVKNHQGF